MYTLIVYVHKIIDLHETSKKLKKLIFHIGENGFAVYIFFVT